MNVQARRSSADALLTAIVIAHLLISVAHGRAHAGAAVPLGVAGNAFVLIVVVLGPIAGLGLRRFATASGGAWLVAVTMAAAFAFGLINHFVIDGPDHVAHVAQPWSALFAGTAILLALTEASGAGVAVWCAVRRRS
jgi:hypothetical protein